ncbi:MAG: GDP-mannose 4,6-dehydratase, partial [Proteobacteria bacterium]|nr:GDP-mannose 4,6-dehydratase [Pseudomonadota bacterium]
ITFVLVARLMKKPLKIETEKQRRRPAGSEVERLLADNRLAREVLGWKPRVGLEDGLKRTIEWLKQSSKRYRSGVYIV